MTVRFSSSSRSPRSSRSSRSSRRTSTVGAVLTTLLVACGASDQSTPTSSSTRAPAPSGDAFSVRVAHRDAKLDAPSFMWISRAGKFDSAHAAATASLAGVARTYALTSEALATVGGEEIHDTGKGPIIARFKQRVGDVEVFRAGLNVAMSRSYEPVAASGLLARQITGSTEPFAIRAAAALDRAWTEFSAKAGLSRASFTSTGEEGGYERFTAPGLSHPARAKKVFFPHRDRLEPAYYVETIGGRGGWSFVVSARDGRILFENDLVRHDAYTYRVHASSETKIPMDGPAGNAYVPHPSGKPDGLKLAYTTTQLVTLESFPFSRNDRWLPVGATTTNDGNNVHAYADLVTPDGFSAGDVLATVTTPGTFDLPYNPALPPNASNAQIQGSVTQLFYVMNFMHDWFYDAGFDEQSGTHQHDNYGRGGRERDELLAEAQDFGGRNNADALTPADGFSPRVQMYIFSGDSAASLVVSAPASVAGTKQVGIAGFGKDVFDLAGTVVVGDDGQGADSFDACEPLTNNVQGKIVLVHRGLCSFVQKAQIVQAAGGVGVLVANVPSSAQPTVPPLLGGTGTNAITIPALGLALADGQALEAAAGSSTVSVTMKRALQTDHDGAHDTAIVSHEWGHVLSNRLVADGSGLTTNQAGGLGEGWSDFVALLVTVRPEDKDAGNGPNWTGAFATGGYALSGQSDVYFGVRRMPYSTDLTKNPLTFKHIQNGVPLPSSVPIAFGEDGSFNAEVHAAGEVWASMLWDCYVELLKKYPFADAQDRMKRYLVAGLKLTPADPTFLEARDALLAAAYAVDQADYLSFWRAFARRGAGVGAEGPPKDSPSNIGVRESTYVGNDVAISVSKLTDDVVTCDKDGVLDAGELGTLDVTVANSGTGVLAAPTLVVTSKAPGVTVVESEPVALGTLKPFESKTVKVQLGLAGRRASENAALDLEIAVKDADLPNGAVSTTLASRFGSDEAPEASATDSVDTKGTSWKAVADDGGGGDTVPWTRKREGANGWWAVADPIVVSDQLLTSPKFTIEGTSFTLAFKHRWSFRISTRRKVDIDGGVVEVSVDGGKTWKDIQEYGTADYNSVIDTGGRGDNPLRGRRAYANKSPGYPDQWVTSRIAVTLPARPDSVQVRFHVGSGTGFSEAPGWEVDDIALEGISSTPFWAFVPHADACNADAPAVDAGPAQTVTAGSTVTLRGTAEAFDPEAVTFAWTQDTGDQVALAGADSAIATFVAPEVTAPTTLSFALRAREGKYVSPTSRVDVTVTPRVANLSASGGCGVGASASPRATLPWAALGVLGLAIAWRRRRRRVTIEG